MRSSPGLSQERSVCGAPAEANRPEGPALPPPAAVRDVPPEGRALRPACVAPEGPRRSRWLRAAIGLVLLTALWLVLTGGAADSWVIGAPAIALGTALIFLHPAAPGWRLSPGGAIVFAGWFAVQSVRGATDVALRAFAWRVTMAPGCRVWRTALPDGAPRIFFANCISLLPGTLTAGIEGNRLVVHMLDAAADLDAELGALEARVAAVFALSLPPAGRATELMP
jgi:multicomponent Na+:H+ antiporter subunit E